jgi:hypothetical protein
MLAKKAILSNASAVSVGLTVDPDPCSAGMVVIEISPHAPGTTSGEGPVPEFPSVPGQCFHICHIVGVLELSELSRISVFGLTKLVSCLVGVNIVASDGSGDDKNTSGPPIVIACVGILIGTCDRVIHVVWSVDYLVMENTENWSRISAWCITL